MPNTKSALKAARQNIRHRKTNLNALEKIRKTIKNFKKITASGKLDEADKALAEAYAALDKAAKKNIIHKNTSSRIKSRLAAQLAKSSKK